MYRCSDCGESVEYGKVKGSMQLPYCKACFKKRFNNDYQAFVRYRSRRV